MPPATRPPERDLVLPAGDVLTPNSRAGAACRGPAGGGGGSAGLLHGRLLVRPGTHIPYQLLLAGDPSSVHSILQYVAVPGGLLGVHEGGDEHTRLRLLSRDVESTLRCPGLFVHIVNRDVRNVDEQLRPTRPHQPRAHTQQGLQQ